MVLATEEDAEACIPVIVACTAKLLKDTETFIRSVTVRVFECVMLEEVVTGLPPAVVL